MYSATKATFMGVQRGVHRPKTARRALSPRWAAFSGGHGCCRWSQSQCVKARAERVDGGQTAPVNGPVDDHREVEKVAVSVAPQPDPLG